MTWRIEIKQNYQLHANGAATSKYFSKLEVKLEVKKEVIISGRMNYKGVLSENTKSLLAPFGLLTKKHPLFQLIWLGKEGWAQVSASESSFSLRALCQYLKQASWDILLRGMDLPSRSSFGISLSLMSPYFSLSTNTCG